ncbi:Peroxidase 4 [Zea mays]|uniref:Peroxidase 4 n=1 Tax=Zea mays TaxID=4577 RepID=A0A3L6F1F0_MAIZE|nr:Peroxidase 4 [Zea mays]
MASTRAAATLLLLLALAGTSSAQLSTGFYSYSCPGVYGAVKSVMQSAIAREKRMGASILRLFFHDCFVQGCDASLLLDDTPSFQGEKMANPNNGSVRGFEVIDAVKSAVEKLCPGVVSCADILAIAARDSVVILLTPWHTHTGAHTIGQARCTNFRAHIYNDTDIDAAFARTRQSGCPSTSGAGGDNNLAPLDLQTPTVFENNYYRNLVAKKGLLHSDQELFNGGATDALVQSYVGSQSAFFADFVAGMIKMGDITPLTGSNNGQIRKNCRRVN